MRVEDLVSVGVMALTLFVVIVVALLTAEWLTRRIWGARHSRTAPWPTRRADR